MGRFAVGQTVQGQGLGKRLLGCAVDRCLHARREVAAYALVVDAKDADTKSFYEHFGFIAFVDRPQSLYLPLG
jgi:predicted GNAT family N-acyltransferase